MRKRQEVSRTRRPRGVADRRKRTSPSGALAMMAFVARARRWNPGLVLIAILVVVAVAVVGYFAWRQSVPGVRAELRPVPKFLGVKTPLTVHLTAARGGIASADVRVVQGSASATVAQQTFPTTPAAQRLELAIAGRDLGLKEGAATLEVRARDGFWRPLRTSDQPIASVPVTIRFTPPTLEVLAATQYLHQGGGGLAALRVKGAARAGVKVGSDFFPAYSVGEGDGGLAVALFALP